MPSTIMSGCCPLSDLNLPFTRLSSVCRDKGSTHRCRCYPRSPGKPTMVHLQNASKIWRMTVKYFSRSILAVKSGLVVIHLTEPSSTRGHFLSRSRHAEENILKSLNNEQNKRPGRPPHPPQSR